MRDELWRQKGSQAVGDEGIQPIYAPFLYMSKADIAEEALGLGVPLHLTWSCYKGGDNHCGRCGTCVERLEAIDEAQQRMVKRYPGTENVWVDHTIYDDVEFWKVEVSKKQYATGTAYGEGK
jgi:7-cyano-7-deazaguanine synthase